MQPLVGDLTGRPGLDADGLLTEEELTILNPAREEVGEQVRAELGVAFATERNKQLDDDCGAIDNVRRIVEAAEKKGLLDEDDDEDQDED